MNNNVRYTGPGFFTLLGLLFIGLKLTGFIDWSWWLVLSPIFAGIALWLLFVIIVSVFVVVNDHKRGLW